MKGLDVNAKKQYEAPTMELLVITGSEMMSSNDHDNGYVDIGGILFPKLRGAFPGYYDE